MSYIDKRLSDSEEVVHRGRFHWFNLVVTWAALIFLGIFLVGIFLFIVRMIRRATTEMAVTNRRVVMKTGLFNVKVDSLTLEAIESVQEEQGLLGRVLGYGRVSVCGKGDLHIDYPAMKQHHDFSKAIEHARSKVTTAEA
ncbi:MAG: PH domain-containing protein [Pseudomonadota bacterium]